MQITWKGLGERSVPSCQEGEEDPRTGQKRKRGVARLEEERPQVVEDDQHERAGEGKQEHVQHPPKSQHHEEQQEPLLLRVVRTGCLSQNHS